MTNYVVICEFNGKGYVPEETYKQLMMECCSYKESMKKKTDDLFFYNAELELKNEELRKLVDKLKEEKQENEKIIKKTAKQNEELKMAYERHRRKICSLEEEVLRLKSENNDLCYKIDEKMKRNKENERKFDFYQIDNKKLREEIEVGLHSEYETGVSFAGRLKELKLEIDRITGKKNQEETPLSKLAYEEISESYTFEELVKKCVGQEEEIERLKQINNEQRFALQKYYQKMDAIKELTEG
jgi:chromosome segregation ATPase